MNLRQTSTNILIWQFDSFCAPSPPATLATVLHFGLGGNRWCCHGTQILFIGIFAWAGINRILRNEVLLTLRKSNRAMENHLYR